MHRSLFVASHFNHALVKRDYAGIRKHFGWDHQNWSRVMFSDESCFSVTSDSGHELLFRECETRCTYKFVCEHDRYNPGMMVWTGIMHNGRTLLHVFGRGGVTSQRYCRVILDHVHIFRGAVGSDFVFMDDNV
ncbi:transposable element Tcb2 transposase [Trichonephila clavipes]|nr:transposable element Tcb2 transposase [Trichonephila clavipes]